MFSTLQCYQSAQEQKTRENSNFPGNFLALLFWNLDILLDQKQNIEKSRENTENLKIRKIMVVVSNLGPPEAGIVVEEAGVLTYINQKNLGKGKLYISEARVSWVGDAGHTFSLEYNHIALHAVARDLTVFPNAENLYLMIDVKLVDSEPSTPR